MKIAMIGHKRIPSREGGIEIVVGELSTRMARRGNDITAYNRKSRHVAGKEFDAKERPTEYAGVRLKWIYTPDNAKLNAIVYSAFSVIDAIFKKYDIIHFHAEGPSAMLPLAKLFGKKCVVTIHGLDWQRAKWGGFAERFLLFGEKCAARRADAVIVLSENVRDYFKKTYNRDTVFIPNGVSEPEIRKPEIIRTKYALEKDGYILYLGRLVPEKGVHYLINAFKALETDKKLVIAGSASHSGEYETELHALAKGNENIVFTGFVQGEELDELFSNAYLYCLPSDLEGMPISLLEAMSYGCCCLTSDIKECTEVCEDKAEYFEKGSEKALADKLDYLIKNKDRTESLKSTAREFILSKYSWDDVCDKTLELYGKVVK